MNGKIPESEYRTIYKSDYTGMNLTELVYGTIENQKGQEETYSLDLITRETSFSTPRPIVFFIHGGGFVKPNDKRQAYIPLIAKSLTKAGYAVVSPDYPVFENEEELLAASAGIPCYTYAAKPAARGIHAAYTYITDHSRELGLDPGRIAIIGGSAGSMAAFHAIADYEDRYSAFINCWGVPEQLPDLKDFPPLLSIHGTADQLVPYEWELPLQEQLAHFHIGHKLITLTGSGHTPLNRMEEFLPDILDWLAVSL